MMFKFNKILFINSQVLYNKKTKKLKQKKKNKKKQTQIPMYNA